VRPVYQMDVWGQTSILWNVGIVAGYMIVPATALRFIPVKPWVRVAGVGFFLTCSITHVYMGVPHSNHDTGRDWVFYAMWWNHLLQVVSLWMFLFGLSSAVRAALRTRRRRRRTAIPGVSGDGARDEQRSW
jgi:hypothetical protein